MIAEKNSRRLDLEHDRKVAEEAGADLLFTPDANEIYPEGIKNATATAQRLKLPDVATRPGLEDAIRPNFFSGVCLVVSRLLELMNPRHCLFGEKDYQQLAVVRRMVLDLSFPVQIVGCPIVREENGLAMSSRNTYLSTEQYEAAAVLNRALRSAVDLALSGETNGETVRSHITEMIATEPLVSAPDYVAIVDAHSLESLDLLAGDVRIILAAHVGRPRLLDNMGLTIPTSE